MKTKRITAFLISLSMILMCLPNNIVFAGTDQLVDKSTPAKIYFDYMTFKPGFDANTNTDGGTDPVAEKVAVTPDKSTIHNGDTFALGIRLSELTRITAATDGLFSISVPFTYDTQYLELMDTKPATLSRNIDKRLGTDNTDSLFTESGSYGDGYTIDTSGTELGSGTVKLAVKTYNEDTSPQPYTGQKDAYLGLLYFKFIQDGSEIPDGTKLFTPTMTKDFNIGFGAQGTTSFEVNADDPNINITPMIVFDLSSVNVAPATYTVTYDPNGGSFKAESQGKATEQVKEGEKATSIPTAADLTAPTETPANAVFDGWKYYSDDPDGGSSTAEQADTVFDEQVTVNSDIKAYAQWAEGWGIKFYPNLPSDGTHQQNPTTVAVKQNGQLTNDDIPKVGDGGIEIPAGYSFKGWSKTYNGDVIGDLTRETLDANSEFYAIWEQNLTITFYANDGTSDDGKGNKQEFTIKPGEDITKDTDTHFSAPTKDHYKIKEWNTERNGSGDPLAVESVSTQTFNESKTYYAIWTPDDDSPKPGAHKVTLTFDPVGGEAPKPESIEVYSGDTVYEWQIPKDGDMKKNPKGSAQGAYKFEGWYESAKITDTNKVEFTAGHQVDDNETVYAHWKYEGADAVTVTFDDNNGNSSYASATVAPNDTLGDAMPASPTKDNASFDEWNTAQDGQDGTTFTGETPVDTTKTVYAQYVDEITIKYNLNGHGDGSAPDPKTGLPSAPYTDPSPETDSFYDFISWNTKQNGTGTDITAADYTTLGAVAQKAQDDGEDTSSGVTLYAQWGYVLGPHASGAVKVVFDKNNSAATEANPNEKWLQSTDILGTGNMPNEPTREHYDFAGWYPAPDGSGTKFTETSKPEDYAEYFVPKTGDGYSDYDELTLYAKWTLKSEDTAQKVTITFKANKDGKGTDTPGEDKTIEIYKGDSIGYVPSAPENGDFTFVKWQTGDSNVSSSDADIAAATDFTAETTFETDTTVYAKWELKVIIGPQNGNAGAGHYLYTGEELDVKFDADIADASGNNPSGKQYRKDITFPDSEFEINDRQLTAPGESGSNSASEFKDAGEYTVSVKVKAGSDAEKKGVKVSKISPATVTVDWAGLTVKVDPETQICKKSSVKDADIEVSGWLGDDATSPSSLYELKYYKWTDQNSDNIITDNELASDATHNTVGYYVIKIELKTKNYTQPTPEKKDTAVGNLHKYEKTTPGTVPAYADCDTVVFYQVKSGNPKANSLTVQNDKTTTKNEDMPLKDSTYKADKDFNKDGTDQTYYGVIPKDTETDTTEDVKVVLEFEAGYDGDITVTVDGQPLDGSNVQTSEGSDGKVTVTVTVPADKLDDDGNTELTIESKTGENDDEKAEYKVVLQQEYEAKIALNYGNSPYGEIMKDSGITDKAAAKSAFDEGNKYVDGYIPANVTAKIKGASGTAAGLSNNIDTYSFRAWVEASSMATMSPEQQRQLADPDINMDRNDYAIFIYNTKNFVDPGFTATDSLGRPIENVTRKITVQRMSKGLSEAGIYDGNYQEQEITIENKPSNYLVTEITKPFKANDMESALIRPDKYTMTYSFEDPITGDTVEESRYVVVLQKRGDTNFSGAVNLQDVNMIYQFFNGESQYFKTAGSDHVITGTARQIYLYRCLDLITSNAINLQDINPVYQFFNKYEALPDKNISANPIEELYVELPDKLD